MHNALCCGLLIDPYCAVNGTLIHNVQQIVTLFIRLSEAIYINIER
jgi:hypothetical protein